MSQHGLVKWEQSKESVENNITLYMKNFFFVVFVFVSGAMTFSGLNVILFLRR